MEKMKKWMAMMVLILMVGVFSKPAFAEEPFNVMGVSGEYNSYTTNNDYAVTLEAKAVMGSSVSEGIRAVLKRNGMDYGKVDLKTIGSISSNEMSGVNYATTERVESGKYEVKYYAAKGKTDLGAYLGKSSFTIDTVKASVEETDVSKFEVYVDNVDEDTNSVFYGYYRDDEPTNVQWDGAALSNEKNRWEGKVDINKLGNKEGNYTIAVYKINKQNQNVFLKNVKVKVNPSVRANRNQVKGDSFEVYGFRVSSKYSDVKMGIYHSEDGPDKTVWDIAPTYSAELDRWMFKVPVSKFNNRSGVYKASLYGVDAKTGAWDILGDVSVDVHAKKLPVLMYHQIDNKIASENAWLAVSEQTFRNQMQYLKNNGFTPITTRELGTVWKDTNIQKPVLVTLDDGYENATKANTIMEEVFGKDTNKFTLFTISSYMKGEQVVNGSNKYLTISQLQGLSNGKVDVQSHTASHPDVRSKTGQNLVDELLNSKTAIQNITKKEVKSIAFPEGAYSDETLEEVKRQGYEYAFTVNGGFHYEPFPGDNGNYEINRQCVTNIMDQESFAKLVQ